MGKWKKIFLFVIEPILFSLLLNYVWHDTLHYAFYEGNWFMIMMNYWRSDFSIVFLGAWALLKSNSVKFNLSEKALRIITGTFLFVSISFLVSWVFNNADMILFNVAIPKLSWATWSFAFALMVWFGKNRLQTLDLLACIVFSLTLAGNIWEIPQFIVWNSDVWIKIFWWMLSIPIVIPIAGLLFLLVEYRWKITKLFTVALAFTLFSSAFFFYLPNILLRGSFAFLLIAETLGFQKEVR